MRPCEANEADEAGKAGEALWDCEANEALCGSWDLVRLMRLMRLMRPGEAGKASEACNHLLLNGTVIESQGMGTDQNNSNDNNNNNMKND